MLELRGKLARLQASSLARNASWMAIGQGANFFLQAGYFVLVARLLGVTQFGIFAGAFGLVNAITPYAALGFPMIFMRYVSVDHDLARAYWGTIMAVILSMTLLIAASLAFIGAELLGPASVKLILVLVLANCCMGQIVTSASTVFQTFEKLKATAGLQALSNLLRLLAIAALYAYFHHANAFVCSIAILTSSTAAAITAAIWVRRRVGAPGVNLKLFRLRFWEGIGFSFAGSTQSAYNDVDKLMLSHYGMNAANGIYTMAYRIVDFATTPVTAIDSAVLPRYFSLNRQGYQEVIRMARRIIPISILAGLASAGLTLLVAPLLIRIVGHGFNDAWLAVRWLCWLPALRGAHQLAGGVLTATGRQNYRTGVQFLVALLNIVLNLIWIPSHGWLGAAWASLISDGTLGVLNISIVLFLFWRGTRHVHLHPVENEIL